MLTNIPIYQAVLYMKPEKDITAARPTSSQIKRIHHTFRKWEALSVFTNIAQWVPFFNIMLRKGHKTCLDTTDKHSCSGYFFMWNNNMIDVTFERGWLISCSQAVRQNQCGIGIAYKKNSFKWHNTVKHEAIYQTKFTFHQKNTQSQSLGEMCAQQRPFITLWRKWMSVSTNTTQRTHSDLLSWSAVRFWNVPVRLWAMNRCCKGVSVFLSNTSKPSSSWKNTHKHTHRTHS